MMEVLRVFHDFLRNSMVNPFGPRDLVTTEIFKAVDNFLLTKRTSHEIGRAMVNGTPIYVGHYPAIIRFVIIYIIWN